MHFAFAALFLACALAIYVRVVGPILVRYDARLRAAGIECLTCCDSGCYDVQGRVAYQGCPDCGRGEYRKAERVPATHVRGLRGWPRPHLLGDQPQPDLSGRAA